METVTASVTLTKDVSPQVTIGIGALVQQQVVDANLSDYTYTVSALSAIPVQNISAVLTDGSRLGNVIQGNVYLGDLTGTQSSTDRIVVRRQTNDSYDPSGVVWTVLSEVLQPDILL